MKIVVKLDGTKSQVELGEGSCISELLEELGLNRETVIVRLNEEVRVEEEPLKPGDEVEIIKAVSGG